MPALVRFLLCDSRRKYNFVSQKVITIVANQNTEELTEEGPVLVTVAEDGTELPVETQMVGEAEGGGVYLIMIKIKRISIAPIYHTRWERRALYLSLIHI